MHMCVCVGLTVCDVRTLVRDEISVLHAMNVARGLLRGDGYVRKNIHRNCYNYDDDFDISILSVTANFHPFLLRILLEESNLFVSKEKVIESVTVSASGSVISSAVYLMMLPSPISAMVKDPELTSLKYKSCLSCFLETSPFVGMVSKYAVMTDGS